MREIYKNSYLPGVGIQPTHNWEDYIQTQDVFVRLQVRRDDAKSENEKQITVEKNRGESVWYTLEEGDTRGHFLMRLRIKD